VGTTPSTNPTVTKAGRRRRTAGALALGATALVSLAGALPAHAQQAPARPTVGADARNGGGSVEQAVALVQPATVRLQMDWHAWVETGDDLGRIGPIDVTTSCTGFVVDPTGYITTAGHCLDGTVEGLGGDLLQGVVNAIVEEGILTPAQAADPDFADYVIGHWKIEGRAANSAPDLNVSVGQGIALSGEKDVKGSRARVIEVNPPSKGDVALVKVEAQDLPIVKLADDRQLEVGTNVLAVGYPGTSDEATDASMTATFKDGKISSKKTREGGLLPVYEVSAAMSQGMSGGPTVTQAGEVIGLNSFYPAGENQQFNFLSPVSLIKETLNRNGVHNEPAKIDQLYHQGVEAYFGGDPRTAVARFDEVLQRQPSHQQAQALRVKAVDQAEALPVTPVVASVPAPESGSSLLPLLLAGAVLAVVVIGGVGTVVVLRSRRPAAPAPQTGPAAPAPPAGHAAPMPPAGPALAATPPPFVAAPTGFGAPAPTPAPAAGPFCPECGHGLATTDRFCPSCGHDRHAASRTAGV
jgi:S1-C subfamily serine protease